jgi:hypothetical protein
MKQTLTKEQVFDLIKGERDYQDSRWNSTTTTSNGDHSWEEWLMYIEHYIGLAKVQLSTKPKQEADAFAADAMRKITTLGFAAMENNGAPARSSSWKS